MERSRGLMNKNRIEGAADQSERAMKREALVTKGKRRKIRDESLVRNKAIHVAIGVRPTASRRCSGCGSSKMKAPSSGCAC